jgi:hypothetical protein
MKDANPSALNRLARQIEAQERWALELARRPSPDTREPADSQRRQLQQDDREDPDD